MQNVNISELKMDNGNGNAACEVFTLSLPFFQNKLLKIVKRQFVLELAFSNTRVSLIFRFQKYFEYKVFYKTLLLYYYYIIAAVKSK